MPAPARRHTKLFSALAITALALAALAAGLLANVPSATGADLSQLQSELSANNAKASSLSSGISALNGQIAQLGSQISLVQSRASAVHAAVIQAEAAIAHDRSAIAHERRVIKRLRHRLALARRVLAAELVSRYEQPQQSLVSLVIDAHGFQQMLDQLQFMKRANDAEQSIIKITETAKLQAQAATARLTRLERADQQAAQQKLTQAHALDGMQSLLSSRRSTLAHIQAARTAALQATQAQGSQLQTAITTARQQLAAAQQAAQQLADAGSGSSGSGSSGSGSGGGSTSGGAGTSGNPGAYNGWAIPYAIVLCESGGQNLPPNRAGASGYYQIIPSTWKQYGGTTAQAYQASKAAQGVVAAKIWDGGKGASNWTCSSIVGIS